jgi:hypothetical protein
MKHYLRGIRKIALVVAMLADRTSSLGDRRGVCTPDLLQGNTGYSLDEAAKLRTVRSSHQYKAESFLDKK